jgi:endonuclease YncB( thermonuclease family)
MAVTVDFDFKREIRKASSKRLIRTSDGDTPVIEQPIRMVSIDTPEKSHYAGGPPISQIKLDRCKDRLQNGFFNDLPQSLRSYLADKITPDAAKRHIEAGQDASLKFE